MPLLRINSTAQPTQTYRVALLGPTSVFLGTDPVRLRARELDVLAAISLGRGRGVSLDWIGEFLWVDEPSTAAVSLRNHISRIRGVVGSDAIITEHGTYRLGITVRLDLDEFDAQRAEAQHAARSGDHTLALALSVIALDHVRDRPLSTLPNTGRVEAERHLLDEQIDAVREIRLAALLETSRNSEAVEVATDLVAHGTDRERIWCIGALAMARLGERRGALGLLQQYRRQLREQSGLAVSHATQRLEALILADDPTLSTACPTDLVDSGRRVEAFTHAGEQFFVGRTQEMAGVLGAIHRIRHNGRAGVVHVESPPGTGRSAFARRLAILSRGEGMLTSLVSCRPLALLPFEPFGKFFDDVLRTVAPPAELATQQSRLALLREPMAAGSALTAWLPDDIVAMTASLAMQQPLVLVIDDADRLEPTTVRVIERLGELHLPVAVILVGQGMLHQATEHEPIHLRRLDDRDATQLFRTVAGRDLNPNEGQQLFRSTAGNPVLIKAAALEAFEDVFPVGRSRLEGDRAPDTAVSWSDRVRRTAQNAVARLDDESLRVVLALAVRQGQVHRVDLEQILSNRGHQNAPVIIGDLIARGLVGNDNDDWSIATEVIRMAVNDAAGEQLQIDLHLAWLDILQLKGRSPIDEVEHARALASSNPDRAIEVFKLAAAAAHGGAMVFEAIGYQQEAVDLAGVIHGRVAPEVLRLRIMLGELYRLIGHERSRTELWSVVDDALVRDDLVIATNALGVMCRLGPSTESGLLDERLAMVAEEVMPKCPDRHVRAIGFTDLSLLFSMADMAKSREYYDLAVVDARELDDPETVAYVLGSCYTSLTDPADWELRQSYTFEMLGLAEQLDDDHERFEALHLLFSCQLQHGDPLIRTTMIALSKYAAALATPNLVWMADYLRASLLQLDNRLDECIEVAARNAESAPVAKSRAQTTYFAQELAVRSAQGRIGEYLEAIKAISADQPLMAGWKPFGAWSAACRGDWDEVELIAESINNGHTLPRDLSWAGGILCLARAIALSGNTERARAVLPLLEPFTGYMGWAGVCSFGPMALGVAELHVCLGDSTAAERALEQATRIVRRLHTLIYDADLEACRNRIDELVRRQTTCGNR